MRPAVARTDSAKPGSRANGGDTNISTSTAAPSAGNADRGRPDARARSAIAPITAALSTLGDGRASSTNPANASPAATAEVRGPTLSARSSSRTAPVTIATFVPLTAVRCDRPAVVKSAAISASRPLTSPSTRPGSSPRGPSGSTAAASRRPSRIRPAAVCTVDGEPSPRRRATGPTARRRSDLAGTVARAGHPPVPAGSAAADSIPAPAPGRAPARITTTYGRRRSPRAPRTQSTTLGGPAPPVIGRGSPPMTSSAVTLARCSASRLSGESDHPGHLDGRGQRCRARAAEHERGHGRPAAVPAEGGGARAGQRRRRQPRRSGGGRRARLAR